MKIKTGAIKFTLIMAVIFTSWALPQAGERPPVIVKADELYETGRFEESNKLLVPFAKTSPDNIDVYWMVARNFYEIG